jgi:hypothetical protein
LARTTTLDDRAALAKAAELLPVPEGYRAVRTVGHTTVEQSDSRGRQLLTRNLDTTVSYQLQSAGRWSDRASDEDYLCRGGSVVQLSQAAAGSPRRRPSR